MEHVLNVKGQPWFIKISGSRGPAILWLHGFTGSYASWASVVPSFAEQFQCVTVDILGHGQSGAPSETTYYSMEWIAESLRTLMALQGHDTFHVVGYSMGGRIALSLAVHHPASVQRLVLESASPGLDNEVERAHRRASDEALASRIVDEGMERFVAYWEKIPLFSSQMRCAPEQLERQRQIRLAHSANGLAGSLRGTGTGAQPSLWASLSTLHMPVMLLTGEEDTKFTTINRRMAQELPGATHHVIANAGHTVHLEQRETYVRHIKSFLKSQ